MKSRVNIESCTFRFSDIFQKVLNFDLTQQNVGRSIDTGRLEESHYDNDTGIAMLQLKILITTQVTFNDKLTHRRRVILLTLLLCNSKWVL